MQYIKRHLELKLLNRLKSNSILTLTGARQTGKSTLLKHLFKDWDYISFDNIQYREEASRDIRLFFKRFSDKIIFDEVQKVPELFHEVKLQVDNDKSKRFILSGSSNFLLMSKITESLAGRTSICELYPFSLSEQYKNKEENILFTLEKASTINEISLRKIKKLSFNDLINSILYGGFPLVVLNEDKEEKLNWFESYQTTVLEKDFRDFIKVKNLSEFSKLYKILAYQTGNIVNYSKLANELSISSVTVKEYINLLITSYQFYLLQPYHKKLSKRLVKSPKIYCLDTGISNYLEKIDNKDKLFNGGRFGNVFENWVINEFIKQRGLLNRKPDFYFFRTASGLEVDFIIDFTDKVIPVEIKAKAKLDSKDINGIKSFMDYYKKPNIPFGCVIYLGDDILYLAKNIIALPVWCL